MGQKEYRKVEADLRKAAARAFKAVMKSIKDEPSAIILIGDGYNKTKEGAISEVADWLFRRREDGSTGN